MAALRVVRPPVCGDPASDVRRQDWPYLVEERRNFCKSVFPRDCRLLLFFIEDGAKTKWLGYGSREAYLRDGLNLNPEVAELALRGLKLSDPNKAVGMDEAIVLGSHGGVRKKGEQGDNVTLKRGNNGAYTLARLDRDRPDLAERVRDGELSTNAAAIEAGFRKPPMTHCPHCGKPLRKKK